MATTIEDLMQHKDYKKMHAAASEHLKGMTDPQLLNIFDDAGRKALYAGDGWAANTIRGLVNGPDAYGDHLRAIAVSMLADRPHWLKYFPAEFRSGIASRLN
ncbi:MAG: hypothetical protein JO359_04930 [Candidatus Eremiobacteraeota bacterium]|nr:hypothetical protein [Candidatus Eremiobacteraeota bacterium]